MEVVGAEVVVVVGADVVVVVQTSEQSQIVSSADGQAPIRAYQTRSERPARDSVHLYAEVIGLDAWNSKSSPTIADPEITVKSQVG